CNDNIADNLVIHLLSIIEQMVPLFTDCTDKVEQTVGSLINIYRSSAKRDAIRQKYLITTTVIITYHSEMALLEFAYNRRQLERDQSVVMSPLLMSAGVATGKDIAHIVDSLPTLTPIQLYHTLCQLFDAIRAHKYPELLSPMIFKPYLLQLIVSCEVHAFHLALELLLSFGLELFSTVEERQLFRQLVVVGTHPSLPIAHRLLVLDFTKSIVTKLKSTAAAAIDWSGLQITSFDGPDTQEKKLHILNESPIESQNLLMSLKPLKARSLESNTRATNSFYRTLHSIVSKRPDIMNEMQDLLISVIFKAPDPNIKRSIALFNAYPVLAKGTTHKLIQNLTNLSVTETFKSLPEFTAFLTAFEWTFKQKDLDLSETQLVFLLTIIHNNSKRWRESCAQALDCCTAVLYHQTISVSVKQTLLQSLQWLLSDRNNDISITSLAQIYILALNTLADDADIKRVFNTTHLSDSGDRDIMQDLSADAPFTITRVSTAESTRRKFTLTEMPFTLDIEFEVDIKEQFRRRFDRVFCLILSFDAIGGHIAEEYEIPILRADERRPVRLSLRSAVHKPFELAVSALFTDSDGTNYRCQRFQTHAITLRDILLPIGVDPRHDPPIGQLCQSVLKHPDAMQTVLCVRQFRSIDAFLAHFDWLKSFVINDDTVAGDERRLICGTAPDRLLVAALKMVNNFVNLFIYTNSYELLPTIYYELVPHDTTGAAIDTPNGTNLLIV
ncbi:unnamed protein product, partial [Oppiella nova]